MPKNLVVKRLRSSDLSFFESFLRDMEPQNKQKGFNLDKKVLIDQLYPTLPEIADAHPENRALVSLTIFGPGEAGAHLLARKIKKEQKNWRLNGEVIHDPAGQLGRYAGMRPDDFAVMEFTGVGAPDIVKCVLVSQSNPLDAALHAAIENILSPTSMSVISELDLEAVLLEANPGERHPMRDWLERESVEDVALGGADGPARINSRRPGRGMTHGELQAAKANAEKNGKIGEELLDTYFSSLEGGAIVSYEWTARANAISPYDFKVVFPGGQVRHIDAKTTSNSFSSPLHISLAELQHALTSGFPYDIYRIFGATESAAQMRVAHDIAPKLEAVRAAIVGLPTGVKVDSFSISPDFLEFNVDIVELGSEDS